MHECAEEVIIPRQIVFLLQGMHESITDLEGLKENICQLEKYLTSLQIFPF